MSENMKELAGVLIAVVLFLDGLLHIYWATGHIWPARNPKALSLAVLNIDISFATPGVFALACALLLGACVVLARVHALGGPGRLIPALLLQLGILAIAIGLLLRGLAGIVWILRPKISRSKLFYKLNLLAYTPVCLLLFAAAVFAALS
jgi:hypothetical protein